MQACVRITKCLPPETADNPSNATTSLTPGPPVYIIPHPFLALLCIFQFKYFSTPLPFIGQQVSILQRHSLQFVKNNYIPLSLFPQSSMPLPTFCQIILYQSRYSFKHNATPFCYRLHRATWL